nr:N-acetylmuramoyl-L-alanine amidase [Zongyanglinia huanghaiensis]
MVPFVESPNHGGSLVGGAPRFLVIHYTAGGAASGSINWFQNPKAKVSAHLVVGRDGGVTQMVHFNKVGWHAGKSRWKNVKGLNSHSIGIEIANWGKLKPSASGGWVSRTGRAVSNERVVLDEHRNSPGKQHGWETFSEEQWDATVAAAQAIVEEYDIKPSDVVGHDDISPMRKIDPGPAFDMDKFRSLIFGREEDSWNDLRYKVNSASGLNLRATPDLSQKPIKNLPDDTVVHVIEKTSKWWLVAEVVSGKDDVTGYVHSNWLVPS